MLNRLLLLLLVICTACDLYKDDQQRDYYVVEAYLVAEAQLPSVRLSETAIQEDSLENFEDLAIGGATVELRKLAADSSIEERFPYEQNQPGIYQPIQEQYVEGKQLYQLHVTLSNGDFIEAKSLVPSSFSTVVPPQNEYTYQGNTEVELAVSPSHYPDRQTYYHYSVNVAEPDSQQLTPFYRDQVENHGNHWGKYFVHSSDIINEESQPVDENGNIIFNIPWLSFTFFGENDIVVNALDDNMYNFLRTQQTQSGNDGLAPGEIQNIRYNINGGIGIFGSIASDTNKVFIHTPEKD